jgi:hypothetical protein
MPAAAAPASWHSRRTPLLHPCRCLSQAMTLRVCVLDACMPVILAAFPPSCPGFLPCSPALIGNECAPLALALGCAQDYKLQDVADGVEHRPQVSLIGLKWHLANKQLPAKGGTGRGYAHHHQVLAVIAFGRELSATASTTRCM